MEQYKNNSIFPFKYQNRNQKNEDEIEYLNVEFTHIFGKILPGQKFPKLLVNFNEGWLAVYSSYFTETNRIKFICKVD